VAPPSRGRQGALEIKIDFRFSLLAFLKCRNDPLAGKIDRISEKFWKKIQVID
jgi:hypothetical protein